MLNLGYRSSFDKGDSSKTNFVNVGQSLLVKYPSNFRKITRIVKIFLCKFINMTLSCCVADGLT